MGTTPSVLILFAQSFDRKYPKTKTWKETPELLMNFSPAVWKYNTLLMQSPQIRVYFPHLSLSTFHLTRVGHFHVKCLKMPSGHRCCVEDHSFFFGQAALIRGSNLGWFSCFGVCMDPFFVTSLSLERNASCRKGKTVHFWGPEPSHNFGIRKDEDTRMSVKTLFVQHSLRNLTGLEGGNSSASF